MLKYGVDLTGKVIITVVDGGVAVGKANDSLFKAIGGRLSGSVVGHGNGGGGRSDQLLCDRGWGSAFVRGKAPPKKV